MFGGELKGMTKALVDSREQVIQRMVDEAEAKGGNAILAMRFDTSEMGGNWTEICAYGTACGCARSRASKHLEQRGGAFDDEVGRLPQLGRALRRGDGDAHGELEPAERPEARRGPVVSSPA